MNTPALRKTCAARLVAATDRVTKLNAFLGLDGFVDEILHVVDKRESADKYRRLPTIARLADRLAGAAGKSTNIELVSQRTKLGGNGPIMANALASLGLQVTYLGNLGYPNLHPVFNDFAKAAEVHSIAEPGYTDAVEFEDGKIMLGKHQSLKQVNWQNIVGRYGKDKFTERLKGADFVGFVNWTMLTHMSDIWAATLREICPQLNDRRRKLFIDLADPEKRTHEDVLKALELIVSFEQQFDVIFGLNEKETCEIGSHLGLDAGDRSPEGLLGLGKKIRERIPVNTLVIHPTAYAVAIGREEAASVEGPFTSSPLITTGAGDHFNAGFCLGSLLGLGNALSLLAGVSASGFYVRTGRSPTIADLVQLLRNWPTE